MGIAEAIAAAQAAKKAADDDAARASAQQERNARAADDAWGSWKTHEAREVVAALRASNVPIEHLYWQKKYDKPPKSTGIKGWLLLKNRASETYSMFVTASGELLSAARGDSRATAGKVIGLEADPLGTRLPGHRLNLVDGRVLAASPGRSYEEGWYYHPAGLLEELIARTIVEHG